MAIARVSGTVVSIQNGAGTNSLASPQNPVSGNTILLTYIDFKGGGTAVKPTITQSAGTATIGTQTEDKFSLNLPGLGSQIRIGIIRIPITGSGDLTLTHTSTNDLFTWGWAEYSSAAPITVDGSPVENNGTASTYSTGNITPGSAGLVLASYCDDSSSPTYGSYSDSSLWAQPNSAGLITAVSQDKVTVSGGTYALTLSAGSSFPFLAIAVAYTDGGGGGATPIPGRSIVNVPYSEPEFIRSKSNARGLTGIMVGTRIPAKNNFIQACLDQIEQNGRQEFYGLRIAHFIGGSNTPPPTPILGRKTVSSFDYTDQTDYANTYIGASGSPGIIPASAPTKPTSVFQSAQLAQDDSDDSIQYFGLKKSLSHGGTVPPLVNTPRSFYRNPYYEEPYDPINYHSIYLRHPSGAVIGLPRRYPVIQTQRAIEDIDAINGFPKQFGLKLLHPSHGGLGPPPSTGKNPKYGFVGVGVGR